MRHISRASALLGFAIFLAIVPVLHGQQEFPPPQGKGRVVVLSSGMSGPGHYEQIGASGQTQAVTAQTLPPTTVVVQDAAPAETVVVEEPGIGYYGPAVIIGSPFFFAPYWGRDGYYHQGWHGGDGGHYYAPGGGYHSPGGRLPGPPLPLPPIRR